MHVDILIVVASSLFAGSFLGVVIDRLPERRSIISGRSTCDHCDFALSWPDLVPLVSYIVLRGRCRHCRGALRPFYPQIELAAVAVAVSAALTLSGWLLFLSVALGWTLLVLAVIDHRHLILPDTLTLPLIPAGLFVAYLINPDLLGRHAVGAAVGLSVFLAVGWAYRYFRGRDGLGTGDAKLLAGAGAWLGWTAIPGVVLLASVGALGLTLLLTLFGNKVEADNELPFGTYLALAFWISWLIGPVVLA